LYEPAPAIVSLNPNAHITPEYESVIAKALAKNPDERYQSMQELCDDLIKIREGSRPTAVTAVISAPNRPLGNVGLIPSTATGGYPSSQTMEMPREAPKKGKTGMMLGVVLGAALLLAGGALALNAMSTNNAQQGRNPDRGINEPGNGANMAADAAVTVLNGTVGAQQPSADAAIALNSADAASAAPTMVRLHFVTVPSGAQVFFQGADEPVCASTPCDVSVAMGESRAGYAVAQNKRGEFNVTASSDGQNVELTLNARRANNTRPNNSGSAAQSGGNHNARNPRCRQGQRSYFDERSQIYRPCL
jgi:hypothetical protein